VLFRSTLQDNDGIHVYRFNRAGRRLWVAWDDSTIACITAPCGRQVRIDGINAASVRVTDSVPNFSAGRDVREYSTAFPVATMPVSGGVATITLGDSPMYIEEEL